jgi:hypothetical protein
MGLDSPFWDMILPLDFSYTKLKVPTIEQTKDLGSFFFS